MATHQKPTRNPLVTIIQGLSVTIIALEILLWGSIAVPALGDAIAEVVPRAQIQVGLIALAPLLGALDIVAGVIALLKPALGRRRVALTGVLVGILGVLTGVFWVAVLSGRLGQVY
jgi:hypothetical protein